VRVEVEREGVGLRERVAPGQLPNDPLGLPVEQPRADVKGVVVEEQTQLGGLGGRLPLVGVPLQEAGDDARGLPVGLVEAAVDGNRCARAEGEGRLGARGRPGESPILVYDSVRLIGHARPAGPAGTSGSGALSPTTFCTDPTPWSALGA
jgi:hypothetical protein